jgi:hypothetical protein
MFPVFAGGSRNVSREDALNGRVPLVVAVEGGGVNLDFSQTGETIQKIMIDDPSKVVVDHCLVSKGCGSFPEPVIRLIRGNIPQESIPPAKTTQLTVLTRDALGEWSTYIFPVKPSTKPADITKFVIGGTDAPAGRGSERVDFAVAALGARQAQSQQVLVDPRLKGRVRTYLQLVQGGVPTRKAAQKAKISKDLVARLTQLGNQRVAQLESQAKVARSVQLPTAPTSPDTPIAVPEVPKIDPLNPPIAFAPPSVPWSKQFSIKLPPAQSAPDKSVVEVQPNLSAPVPSPIEAQPSPLPTPGLEPPPLTRPVEVSPPKPVAAKAAVKVATTKSQSLTYAAALQRGLIQARLDKRVSYGSWKWNQVNTAIRSLRYGDNLDRAITLSNLPAEAIKAMIRDGGCGETCP